MNLDFEALRLTSLSPQEDHPGGAYTPDASLLFGLVDLHTDTVSVPDAIGQDLSAHSDLHINGISIPADTTIPNQPKAPISQGVRSILIDKFLDPQIRYLANNLTKMHFLIKWPDVNGMARQLKRFGSSEGNSSLGRLLLDRLLDFDGIGADLGKIKPLQTQKIADGLAQAKKLVSSEG